MSSAAAPRARLLGIALAALLLETLCTAGPGATQDPTPTPVPSPTPIAIPIPEIATQAEETAARLRAIETTLKPSTEVQAIDAAASASAARIDARFRDHAAALEAGPALRALAHMTAAWQTERGTLTGWGQTLTWYANELERQIQDLATLTSSWSATLDQAKAANAPPAVIGRIQETLGAISDTRHNVERYRAQILSLQDRVARETATSDEAIDRIANYRKREVGQIFVRDTQPWLGGLFFNRPEGGTAPAIRNALRDELSALPEFARSVAPMLAVQVLLLVALCLIFRQAQRRAATWVEHDAGLDRATHIFRFPYSCAVIVVCLLSNWLFPWAPHMVTQLFGIIGLVPVTRVVRALVQPRLIPAVYGLAAFFVCDRIRDVVAPVPQLEQTILMIEMAAGIVILVWMLRRGDLDSSEQDDGESALSTTLRGSARVVLAAFVVALVSGLLGYMRLAHLIGGGTLIGAYLATALFASMRALDGLVAYALRARPLRLLRMVRRHRPLIQANVWRLLRWLGAAAWIIGALYQFQILDMIVEDVTKVLTTSLSFGAISLTLGDVLAFAITIWLSFLTSRFVRFTLEEDVFPKVELARGVPYAITSLIHYVILISGTLLAFAVMGLDLNRFTILAGALGVGVGFGLQNIVNNFVSGLILLFERPVQVGDTVQINQISGEVKRIGIRSSTVRTGDGAEVIVPNASLIAEPVTNWTLSDRMRKVNVALRVAYGSDPERVLAILLEVARANERVLQLPESAATLTVFGENGIEFVLEAWIARHEQHGEIRSELSIAVWRSLRAAGIEMVVPQREVRVRSGDDDPGPAQG